MLDLVTPEKDNTKPEKDNTKPAVGQPVSPDTPSECLEEGEAKLGKQAEETPQEPNSGARLPWRTSHQSCPNLQIL